MPHGREKFAGPTGGHTKKKSYVPSAKSVREHEGREPQPGVPTGPRSTRPYAPVASPAKLPNYTAPATAATSALPHSSLLSALSDLLTPGGEPHPREIAEAAHTLGVKPREPSTPVRSVVHGLNDIAASLGKDLGKLAKLPDQHVSEAFGHKTLGTPTLRSVVRAYHHTPPANKAKGALPASQRHPGRNGLTINKAGQLVTPRARKAVRQLRHAQQAFQRHAVPQISGISDPDQREFAQWLSHYTKIPPKLAGEWVKQEGGGWGSSGVSGGQAGEQNWLGVGYPAHTTPFSASHYFNNTTPKAAAKATAEWIEGKIGHDYGYGAAPSIQRIGQLAKEGASESEIRSYIEGPSGWGTGRIAQSGITATGASGVPQEVRAHLQLAKKNARAQGINPTPFNGDIAGGGSDFTIVRADAKGMVNWAESATGTQEGTAKAERWGAKFGLNTVTQPWCANFVSNGLLRRGITNLPSNPNYVPSYESEWGKYAVAGGIAKAKPGDLLAFSGQHIGIYVGNGEMVSGNFSDEVQRSPISAEGAPLSMVIRPPYKGGKVKVADSQIAGSTASAATGGVGVGESTLGGVGGAQSEGVAMQQRAPVSTGSSTGSVPISELLQTMLLTPNPGPSEEATKGGTIARILARRRL